MKNIIVILLLIPFAFNCASQDIDTLKDCDCIIEGECVQYLDSLLMPTTKEEALYKRFNYKSTDKDWPYAIIDHLGKKHSKFEILGKEFITDSIVTVDGIYKYYYGKSWLCYEVHYKDGYPLKNIAYYKNGKLRTVIDYTEQYFGERWSDSQENYNIWGHLLYKNYYRLIDGKRVWYEH